MKIYVSGKIGVEVITDAIRDKFNRVAAILEKCGHEVVNPVDPERQDMGSRYQSTRIGDIYTRHLLYDLSVIATCDAVFFLPDWTDSPGAMSEFAFAHAIGKLRILGAYTGVPTENDIKSSLFKTASMSHVFTYAEFPNN